MTAAEVKVFHRNQKRILKHPPSLSGAQTNTLRWESEKCVFWQPRHKVPSYCSCTRPGWMCWNTRPGTHNGWGQGQQSRHFLTENKPIKMSGRDFLETAPAPSKQFPLIKRVNFLQQCWKRGLKMRRCLLLTQESRPTASVSALEPGVNTHAGRAAAAPSGGFEEPPVKTQTTGSPGGTSGALFSSSGPPPLKAAVKAAVLIKLMLALWLHTSPGRTL